MVEKVFDGITTSYVLTYGDILETYSQGFLDILLRAGIFLSLFTFASVLYFSTIETPGILYYCKDKVEDKSMLATQIMKSGSMIALIVSLFLLVTVGYYKMGWY